jgi:hypothetical protein
MRLAYSRIEILLKIELMHLALQAIWADHRAVLEEARLFKALAERMLLPAPKLIELGCYLRPDHPSLPCPNLGILRREAQYDALYTFVDIILCDHELAEEELGLYCELIDLLQISDPVPCHATSLLDQQRGDPYVPEVLDLYEAERVPTERAILERLVLSPPQRHLLKLLDAPQTLGWLVRHSGMSQQELLTAFRALKRAGLVSYRSKPASGT